MEVSMKTGGEFLKMVSLNRLKTIPYFSNLKDGFLIATILLDARDAEIRPIFAEAQKEHLGRYTAEQEADELAAEFLTKIGINPEAAVRSLISLTSSYDLSGAQLCNALYRKNWRNEKGDVVILPLGEPSEYAEGRHHGGCFRAYNLDRDIKAHGYDNIAYPYPPHPPEPNWHELQVIAKSL
jgi:hypothetical protein